MIKVESTKGLYNIYGVYAIRNVMTDQWYFGSSIANKGACRGIETPFMGVAEQQTQ